jgi:hypothetical protein
MRREADLSAMKSLTLTVLLALLLGLLLACGGGEDAAAPKPGDEELAWLKENYPTLGEKRAELKQVQAWISGEEPIPEPAPAEGAPAEGTEGGEDAPAEGAPAEGTEGGEGAPAEGAEGGEGAEPAAPPTPEELEGRATALASEIENLTVEVGEKVVAYINGSDITVGTEYTPDQQFVIDIKIMEDIVVAKEYIARGGDYGRALDIYHGAQQLDVDHPKLLAAIKEAETNRYMSEERFKLAKKNMTQDEIRGTLGQVKHTNITDYEDQGVQAWFYKKENGGAAGVFFKKKKDVWKVYKLDFNAAPGREEGEEG